MSFTNEQRALVAQCKQASLDSSLNFGQIVGRLVQGGIESYQADYRRADTTYYLPDGDAHALPLPQPDVAIAATFDATAVKAAILDSQRNGLAYPEFIRRTRAAGCVGYTVWIAGRHVQYFGRRGEQHVERFPD